MYLHIMLSHEYHVEEETDIAQPEFHWVAGQSRPIALKRRIDDQLKKRKDSAGHVKKDLVYAPSSCRLALVVEVCLGAILNHCAN